MESYITSQIIYELNNDICDENSLKEEKDYENDFQNESYFTPQSEIPETQLNKTINNNPQMNSNSLDQLNIINIYDFLMKGNNKSAEEGKNAKKDRYYIGRKKIREENDGNAHIKNKTLDFKIYEQQINDTILKSNKIYMKNQGKFSKDYLMEENEDLFREKIDELNLEESSNEIIVHECVNSKDFRNRIIKINDKSNNNINKHLIYQKNFINYNTKNKSYQNKLDKYKNDEPKFLESLFPYNNDNIYSQISFNERKDDNKQKNSTGMNDFSYILNFQDKNRYKCNQYCNCIMDMDI